MPLILGVLNLDNIGVRAATEIDAVRMGRSPEFSETRTLSRLIREAIPEDVTSVTDSRFLASDVFFMHRVFKEVEGASAVTISDLARVIRGWANRLEALTGYDRKAVDFCLAISRQASVEKAR